MPDSDRHHYIPYVDTPRHREDKTIYAGHLVGPDVEYAHYSKAVALRLRLNTLIRIMEGTDPEDA